MTAHADWVDAQQVAEHVGVSLRTIRSWTKAGTIPFHRVGPKLVRYDLGEVDEALRKAR